MKTISIKDGRAYGPSALGASNINLSHRHRMGSKVAARLTLLMLVAPCGHAGVIDFESINGATPVEGVAISNQFQANFGISFRRRTAGKFPVIAKFGPPMAAFHLNLRNASSTREVVSKGLSA